MAASAATIPARLIRKESQDRMVKYVESVRSELGLYPLCHPEVFHEGSISIKDPRSSETIKPNIA